MQSSHQLIYPASNTSPKLKGCKVLAAQQSVPTMHSVPISLNINTVNGEEPLQLLEKVWLNPARA